MQQLMMMMMMMMMMMVSAVERAWRCQIAFFVKLVTVRRVANDLGVREGPMLRMLHARKMHQLHQIHSNPR